MRRTLSSCAIRSSRASRVAERFAGARSVSIAALTRSALSRHAELAVLPDPGKLLRGLMDRFPGLGPGMNRATGTNNTVATVAKYREQEARLAAAHRDASQTETAK